jgi:hypothetical protein
MPQGWDSQTTLPRSRLRGDRSWSPGSPFLASDATGTRHKNAVTPALAQCPWIKALARLYALRRKSTNSWLSVSPLLKWKRSVT